MSEKRILILNATHINFEHLFLFHCMIFMVMIIQCPLDIWVGKREINASKEGEGERHRWSLMSLRGKFGTSKKKMLLKSLHSVN